MPEISVIVPVFNAEAFLAKCVDSVLGQSFSDFELILVNDGSADNSGKICDAYALRERRIRVVHQANQGAAAARNAGMAVACGTYLTFIDSDDYVPEDYLSQLLLTAQEGYDLAVCPCVRPEHTDTLKTEDLQVDFRDPSEEQKARFNKLFASYVLYGPCTKLYKREIIERNGVSFPVDIRQGEDFVFVFTYLKYCDTIHYRSQPVYFYYENTNSVTHQIRKNRFANGLRVNSACLDCMNEKGFMTPEIQGVLARATFKDAYHGIEDIFAGNADTSVLGLWKQVNAIMKHPALKQAMKIADTDGYNQKLAWLMRHQQTVLYCAVRELSRWKQKLIKN